MDKKNAAKGDKHERLFSNTIKNELSVLSKLKEYFGIDGGLAKAYPTGSAGGKADVILSFTGGKHLSANVKSFGKVGVNQATRGTVHSFVDHCNLPDLSALLEQAVVRKSRKGRFILDSDKEYVYKSLAPKAKSIVQFALARIERPELLVLYDNVANIMYLYDLSALLEDLSYEVTFSKPANIMIAEYFLFHRKGGDGNDTRFEKTSSKHPGNDLAVKLLCRKYIANNEPIVSYKPNEKKSTLEAVSVTPSLKKN